MTSDLIKDNKNREEVAATDVPCCKKITVFACVCGVFSLILHAYSYAELSAIKIHEDLHSRHINKLIENRIQERFIELMSTTSPHRLKRDAMLVSINIYYIIILKYSTRKWFYCKWIFILFSQKQSPIEEDNTVAPHVEFFNPKMRPELEEKDSIEMKRTGAKGPAPGDDTWVWLTSYSRVPVSYDLSLIWHTSKK